MYLDLLTRTIIKIISRATIGPNGLVIHAEDSGPLYRRFGCGIPTQKKLRHF